MTFWPVFLIPLLLLVFIGGWNAVAGLNARGFNDTAYWLFHMIGVLWLPAHLALKAGAWPADMRFCQYLKTLCHGARWPLYAAFWPFAVFTATAGARDLPESWAGDHVLWSSGHLLMTCISAAVIAAWVRYVLGCKYPIHPFGPAVIAFFVGAAGYGLLAGGGFLPSRMGQEVNHWYIWSAQAPALVMAADIFFGFWAVMALFLSRPTGRSSWVVAAALGLFGIMLGGYFWGYAWPMIGAETYYRISLIFAFVFYASLLIGQGGINQRGVYISATAYILVIAAGGAGLFYSDGYVSSVIGFNPFDALYPEMPVLLSEWLPVTWLFLLRDGIWLIISRHIFHPLMGDWLGAVILLMAYWPLAALMRALGADGLIGLWRPFVIGNMWQSYGPVMAELMSLVLWWRHIRQKRDIS